MEVITQQYATVQQGPHGQVLSFSPERDSADHLLLSADDYPIGTIITIRTPVCSQCKNPQTSCQDSPCTEIWS